MSGRVIVVGSINLDLVARAPHLPGPGETVLGGEFERHPGGKGANQAVAAARAGARVAMIGAVGRDDEGRRGLAALEDEGVGIEHVARKASASGVALIVVAPGGENQIVVAPGANNDVSADAVHEALQRLVPRSPDVVLASLEVPMPAVRAAALLAAERACALVINPAPAAPLPREVLTAGPVLTPNRGELRALGKADDLDAAAESLLEAGAVALVVTLGADGCAVLNRTGRSDIPGQPVASVDTTGAGDTFSGVLAARLAAGDGLERAARTANAAAALSVRTVGARTGMPREPEIAASLASSETYRRAIDHDVSR